MKYLRTSTRISPPKNLFIWLTDRNYNLFFTTVLVTFPRTVRTYRYPIVIMSNFVLEYHKLILRRKEGKPVFRTKNRTELAVRIRGIQIFGKASSSMEILQWYRYPHLFQFSFYIIFVINLHISSFSTILFSSIKNYKSLWISILHRRHYILILILQRTTFIKLFSYKVSAVTQILGFFFSSYLDANNELFTATRFFSRPDICWEFS